MSKTYRVVRTETIEYVEDFTIDQLLEMGYALEHVETADDFRDSLQSWSPAFDLPRDAVVEATEPHGEVQGSTFEVIDVTAHVTR